MGGSKDFDSGDYEMRLRIDEISRNDLDSPVVLVKEVRKKSGAGRSKSFTYEVQVSTSRVEFIQFIQMRNHCKHTCSHCFKYCFPLFPLIT